jgi:hypothetical protein
MVCLIGLRRNIVRITSSPAPLVWLHSTETYYPSDIGSQLVHTQPEINYSVVSGTESPLTLDNLNSSLASYQGSQTYLTSKDNIGTNPAWLNGVKPDASGRTGSATGCAIIINDHSSDTSGFIDVFYMYFYAFNYGTFLTFLNNPVLFDPYPIGNHVGDWEHNMIRFDSSGTPQAIWYSQHDNGEAFTYAAVEKSGLRPIAYSANGSHANYATAGTHAHGIPDINLPIGPVQDYTNQGALWDPTLNAYFYSFDASTSTFGTYDSTTPTDWLSFTGMWGDEQYNSSNPLQEYILGISATAKYVGGPTGPEDKQLNRTNVCPDNGDLCVIRVIKD